MSGRLTGVCGLSPALLPPTLFFIFLQKIFFSLKLWCDLRDKKLKILQLFLMADFFLKFLKLASRLRAIKGRRGVTVAGENALYFFKAFGRSNLTRQCQQTMLLLAAVKVFR